MLWPARHNRYRTKKPAAQRRDGGAARGAFRGWTLYGARHSLRCQALDDPVLIITGLAFPAVPEAVVQPGRAPPPELEHGYRFPFRPASFQFLVAFVEFAAGPEDGRLPAGPGSDL